MFKRHQPEETNFWPIVSDFMLGLFLLAILFVHNEKTKVEVLQGEAASHKQTYDALRCVTIEQNNKLGKEGDILAPMMLNCGETKQKAISDALVHNVEQAVLRLHEIGVSNSDMRLFVVEQSNKLASYVAGKTLPLDCNYKEAETALRDNIEMACRSICAVSTDVHEIGKAFQDIADIVGAEKAEKTQSVVDTVRKITCKANAIEKAIRRLADTFNEIATEAESDDVVLFLKRLNDLINELQKEKAQLERSIRELADMFEDIPTDTQFGDMSNVIALLKDEIQGLMKEKEKLESENRELKENGGDNTGMPIFEISSREVSFEHGESALDERNKKIVLNKLDELKQYILANKHKVTDIMFVGFTDKSGTDISNSNLGLLRAATIRTIWDEYVGKQPTVEQAILRSKVPHNFSAGWSEATVPASVVDRNKNAGAKDRHISIYLIGLEKKDR